MQSTKYKTVNLNTVESYLYPTFTQIKFYNKKKQKEKTNTAYTLAATDIYSSKGSKAEQIVRQGKIPLENDLILGKHEHKNT